MLYTSAGGLVEGPWGQGPLLEAGNLKELARLPETERKGRNTLVSPFLPPSSVLPVPSQESDPPGADTEIWDMQAVEMSSQDQDS